MPMYILCLIDYDVEKTFFFFVLLKYYWANIRIYFVVMTDDSNPFMF